MNRILALRLLFINALSGLVAGEIALLLGKQDGISTDILRSRFTDVDRAKWIPWTTPELTIY